MRPPPQPPLPPDFKRASTLLLDSIATFTATELFDYATFTFYVVLAGLLSLERAVLKKRVIDSPDVLAAISDVPHLAPVLNAYYECRYSALMASLVALYPAVVRDRYLSRHAPFILRELRIGAYTQFLESYKSVTLRGMADAFGVRDAFLDAELSRFIAAGRIHAQMDAVAGEWEGVGCEWEGARASGFRGAKGRKGVCRTPPHAPLLHTPSSPRRH